MFCYNKIFLSLYIYSYLLLFEIKAFFCITNIQIKERKKDLIYIKKTTKSYSNNNNNNNNNDANQATIIDIY